MKILELQFRLRNPFVELSDLFQAFNNMVYAGQISQTKIEINNCTEDGNTIYYLCIDLYRGKDSFSSLSIKRDLQDEPSAELSTQLKQFYKLQKEEKKYFPFFHVDKTGTIITISIYSKFSSDFVLSTPDDYINESLNSSNTEILYLSFWARKPFESLSGLLGAVNKMYKNNVSSFIYIKSSCDEKAAYLNMLFLFENKSRPSFSITIGLVGNSIPPKYQIDLAKFNFACSQIPNYCPVFLNCLVTSDTNCGPAIQIHVYESTNSETREKIDNQFKLLDSIAPL